MDSHSIAATEELVTYRNVSSKVGSTTPADYTTWFTVITTNEYNRLASPTSRDPVFEIGYIPGDLRGANYDKVNLFLEKTTCISYIIYLITEGVVPNADKFVLLELPVKNLLLFRHIGGHGSDFFDRDNMSLTWAIHAGSVYYLKTIEKSLQKVSYMSFNIGTVLDRLSRSNGFAWDYWCCRKIQDELPALLDYLATHHEARAHEHEGYMFYRNLMAYIGVHATTVFGATTNQNMQKLIDHMGMRLQRPQDNGLFEGIYSAGRFLHLRYGNWPGRAARGSCWTTWVGALLQDWASSTVPIDVKLQASNGTFLYYMQGLRRGVRILHPMHVLHTYLYRYIYMPTTFGLN